MNKEAIIAALVKFARRIGRWLIKQLIRLGGAMLRGYMLGKIDDFKRRLARAKTDQRRRRLTGRITRWAAAVKWLTQHAVDADKVAKQVDEMVGNLPMVAIAERSTK